MAFNNSCYLPAHLLLFVVVCSVENVDGTCGLFLRTNALVERRLLSSGFHRNLETVINISAEENISNCLILVKEIFPTGAYIDPYQLQFHRDFGGPDFFVPQVVNIETPEHQSPKIIAYFLPWLQSAEKQWVVNMTVPIHLRYHRARSGEKYPLEAIVHFSDPSVLILCPVELPLVCQPLTEEGPCVPLEENSESCLWLPVTSFSTSVPITAAVPIGDSDLLDTVMLATVCITGGATVLLLAVIQRKFWTVA